MAVAATGRGRSRKFGASSASLLVAQPSGCAHGIEIAPKNRNAPDARGRAPVFTYSDWQARRGSGRKWEPTNAGVLGGCEKGRERGGAADREFQLKGGGGAGDPPLTTQRAKGK